MDRIWEVEDTARSGRALALWLLFGEDASTEMDDDERRAVNFLAGLMERVSHIVLEEKGEVRRVIWRDILQEFVDLRTLETPSVIRES